MLPFIQVAKRNKSPALEQGGALVLSHERIAQSFPSIKGRMILGNSLGLWSWRKWRGRGRERPPRCSGVGGPPPKIFKEEMGALANPLPPLHALTHACRSRRQRDAQRARSVVVLKNVMDGKGKRLEINVCPVLVAEPQQDRRRAGGPGRRAVGLILRPGQTRSSL
jgi:hypothetical protein